MTRTRKFLVGAVATLSLLGVGGVAQAATPDTGSVSATRWCC